MSWLWKSFSTGSGRSALGVGWGTARSRHISREPRCQACGYLPTQGNNDVHHIIPRHIDESKMDDPDNLITLCRKYDCHLRFGHFGDYKRFWNPTIRAILGGLGIDMMLAEVSARGNQNDGH